MQALYDASSRVHGVLESLMAFACGRNRAVVKADDTTD
ncbi:unnamed protein product, partial [Amoebophrya sp. A25]|eukprot:GSA25T00006539001.1